MHLIAHPELFFYDFEYDKEDNLTVNTIKLVDVLLKPNADKQHVAKLRSSLCYWTLAAFNFTAADLKKEWKDAQEAHNAAVVEGLYVAQGWKVCVCFVQN